jgi:hypothetical protein
MRSTKIGKTETLSVAASLMIAAFMPYGFYCALHRTFHPLDSIYWELPLATVVLMMSLLFNGSLAFISRLINLQPLGQLRGSRMVHTLSKLEKRMSYERELLPLLDLLEILQDYPKKCSHARDNLFAVLGLCTEAYEVDFRPNYSEEFEQIVCRYAQRFLLQGEIFRLLHRASIVPLSPRFPSWIPDWTSKFDETIVMKSLVREYNPPRVGYNPESKVLCIQGAVYGRVTLILDSVEWKTFRDDISTKRERDHSSLLLEAFDIWIPDRDMHRNLATLHSWFWRWPGRLLGRLYNDTEFRLAAIFARFPGHERTLWDFWRCLKKSWHPPQTLRNMRLGIVNDKDACFIHSDHVKVGDLVCLFNGCSIPFVLRESEEGFQLVGECYLKAFITGGSVQTTELKRDFALY